MYVKVNPRIQYKLTKLYTITAYMMDDDRTAIARIIRRIPQAAPIMILVNKGTAVAITVDQIMFWLYNAMDSLIFSQCIANLRGALQITEILKT